MTTNEYSAYVNAKTASAKEYEDLLFAGHAHFTAMQMRNHAVKGLDLHIERLQKATRSLFKQELDVSDVEKQLSTVARLSPPDASLTVTLYSSDGEFTPRSDNATLNVLIKTAPPHNGPTKALSLKSFAHQRPLAHIKHVGEVGKTFFMRQAHEYGFDDALFVDLEGFVTEGSIWNIALWDGETVIWPDGELLAGTMMESLKRQLSKLGISHKTDRVKFDKLSQYRGAVLLNSWTPSVPITQIDSISFPDSSALEQILKDAYTFEPNIQLL